MSLLKCESLVECHTRFNEIKTEKTFKKNTDLGFLLKQSSTCRICSENVKHPLTKKVADEINSLFCESYIDALPSSK